MKRIGHEVAVAALAVALSACSSVAGTSPSVTASAGSATPSGSPTVAPSVSPTATASSTASLVLPTPSLALPTPSATAAPSPAALPAAWSRLEATGPSPREDHTLTVGPDGVAWLFGGHDGATVYADLWRLDLATDTWTEVAVDGAAPGARFGHTATWVDGIGVVVWAGQAGSTFFDDLWAWDPGTLAWRELPAAGERPVARYGSCAALGPDGRLWVSHGFTSDFGRFDDTWAYEFDRGRWVEETIDGGPFVRCLHDCLFTPDGRFLVYAGQTTGAPAIGDLWARDRDGGWTEAPTPEPAPRQLYALAARSDAAWIFGGGASDGSKLGDLWRLDLTSLTWQEVQLDGGPSPRSGAALVRDEDRDRLILVGGLTEDGASAETWVLEFGS